MSWRPNPMDDFIVHQAPLPIDRPVDSDRHFNDGYWFGFYTDGIYCFCGLRAHPNNNVMDGYAGAVADGEQRTVRFSRALRPRTGELAVGPLRIDILEPLERLRLRLGANEVGVEWDVELTALGLWGEDRAQQFRHGVVLNDVLRYTGVCRPAGWVTLDGREIAIDDSWGAARDHSWGMRSTMGPRTPLGGVGGRPRDPRATRFWVPFTCGEQIGFFHGHEDGEGSVLDFDGSVRHGDREIVLAALRHDFEYHPGTNIVQAGRFVLVGTDGEELDYEFEVCCEGVHPQGFGYNQGWSDGGNPGVWRGDEVEESSRRDVRDPAAKPFADHLPEARRIGATEFAARLGGPDGTRGMAMIEHMVYGKH
jgi:hypothetical protein